MTEIKRPNYFTSQFLVEGDFNDEQAYHLTFRRRHNRVLHTSGVADGFDVTAVANAQPPKVTIAPGTAIDNVGNEIVLNDAVTYQLTVTSANTDVFLSVKYNDVLDPADKYTPAPEHFTRTTERPLFQDGAAVPTDPSAVLLARIHLDSNAQIQAGAIDTTVRTASSAKLGLRVVGTTNLADTAVTNAKLAAQAVDAGKLLDGAVTTAKLAANAVDATKLANTSVTLAKLASGSVDATKVVANSLGVGQLAAISIGPVSNPTFLTGTISGLAVGTSTTVPIATDLTTQAHLMFGLIVSTSGGTAEWKESANFLGTNHSRRVVVTNTGSVAINADWKAVLIPI